MSKTKIIFISMHGEKNQGGDVLGAFKKYEDAEACALATPRSGGSWVKVKKRHWESGCDFIKVVEVELE